MKVSGKQFESEEYTKGEEGKVLWYRDLISVREKTALLHFAGYNIGN